jgi:hypothetical protein
MGKVNKEKKMTINTGDITPRNPFALAARLRGKQVHKDKLDKVQSKYRAKWRRGMEEDGFAGVDWFMLDEKKIKVHPDLRLVLKRNPGWYIDGTKGRHHRLVHDGHPGKWVTAARTPSDHRTYDNVEGNLKAIVAGRETSQASKVMANRAATPRADALIQSGLSKRKQKQLRRQGKID